MLGILPILLSIRLLALPSWLSDLNPEAKFGLTWRERYERDKDLSGPWLKAQAGIFPTLTPELRGGVELAAAETDAGSLPLEVALSNQSSSKTLAVSQAFIGYTLTSKVEWSGLVGKFESPLYFSPLMWNRNIYPEGLLQSLDFLPQESAFKLAIYAGQFSVDQVQAVIVSSTPLRRSWLFQQGIVGSYDAENGTHLKLAVNLYFYHDLSERVANTAGTRGNTIVGTIGNNPHFRYHYAPLEVVGQMEAVPLGIRAALSGAFAINFRTPDRQRAFFVQASLGNLWKRGNFSTDISYYYNEPDVTVAQFSDVDYAYANRKAARFEASYFILDSLRFAGSFTLADNLRTSPFQASYKEWTSKIEMVF